jgi:hypothetical protein
VGVKHESGRRARAYLELERLDENALHALDKEKISKEKEAKQQYRIMKDVPYWVIFKAGKAP